MGLQRSNIPIGKEIKLQLVDPLKFGRPVEV